MPRTDVVVIGASAGGIEPIRTILSGLPAGFPAALFIVVHTSPHAPGVLDVIFSTAGVLPAVIAKDRERIVPGTVYVALPDHHLLIEPGRMRLTRGPKENRFRPAVDPLFRSAAQTYGPLVIGIILSGGLDDGTAGLRTVKQLGGTAIVQDPEEAWFPSMPESALQHVRPHHVLRASEIAPLLVKLTAGADDVDQGGRDVPDEVKIEVDIAKENKATDAGVLQLGDPSNYACPECHGVLLEMKERAPLRFRCHTGHAYTIESLASEMDEMIEESLWSAIRALEERALLMRQAGEHLRAAHQPADDRYLPRADDALRRAELVRQALFDPQNAGNAVD
ncbi:MAG TPA: chemotaxis protein CheB [Thermoanaerobaculia bacterium]|nr:chemotaxis protein CheB [Thermoanaerobaculia bacterium]